MSAAARHDGAGSANPGSGNADALAGFSPATRAWFEASFDAPTAAQVAAWQAIGSGHHALVVAPTGSGKTLAAFLHSLDALAGAPAADGVRVLYVSPLKALAVDVERNLRAPLRGIGLHAEKLGMNPPEVRVAVRSGDTPANERRRLASHPPDILITTPESLFLMLSSQVGSTLAGVQTVIIDEVHALAGTKRGAHLALSLERLSAMTRETGTEPQRIGLSATVRPAERVARFLAGDRDVLTINAATRKRWDLSVQVPVADMSQIPAPATADPTDKPAPNASIWPHLEARILDLIGAGSSTICFVNSRRVAERLTVHLNELHADRLGFSTEEHPPPAEIMAQSGTSHGIDGTTAPVIARAHHGSVSKERRLEIESDLKSGRLRCVVATSSLELGIDMGAVDQVIQVASPPSVASGLQRIGRAGHQVEAVSRGVVLPTHRGDLVESVVLAQRMVQGLIEEVPQLRNPLDVLAQQLVSICLDASPLADELYALVTHADAYSELPRSAFDAALDMLTGRYPSEDFAEFRPRLSWDRISGVVSARPGARRLVTTSGGTIPDRGLFGVFLVSGDDDTSKRAAGRRVGELDEEMVYESRVGDTFTLGTSGWRIEEITPNQVMVTPAPGVPGRLPFWKGDQPPRPAELGAAMGAFLREFAELDSPTAAGQLREVGLDKDGVTNLFAYLADQREATGQLPDDRTILMERFHDELGDWQVCLHSSLGTAVLQPWALAIERRAREEFGVEAHASATNDGIILRLPDVGGAPPGAELVLVDPDQIADIVTDEVYGSALFASRFRECAARALLLPRRDPRRRSPLWQQRMRSAQLLSVASNYPEFPIVLETMRECLHDVFDLPALTEVLGDLAARRIRLIEVTTEQPSPFARSLLFGYLGEFIYDGDQPLAERKLAAMSLDPGLLAELLGQGTGEELFDADVLAGIDRDLQHLSDHRQAATPEQLWDIIRQIGPLTPAECVQRCRAEDQDDAGDTAGKELEQGDAERIVDTWLHSLLQQRRLARVSVNGRTMLAVSDDLGVLRDGLGVPTPPGYPSDEPLPSTGAAVHRLVDRFTRSHAISHTDQIIDRFGLSAQRVGEAVHTLTASGDLISTDLTVRPPEPPHLIRSSVLTTMRRRMVAALRAGVEPAEPAAYARFLLGWHEVDDPQPGVESLLSAVDLLAGYRIPASMLESLVLPARVRDYRPTMLDEVLSSGEVVWTGAGGIGARDGWIQLWPVDHCLATPTVRELGPVATELLEHFSRGGAWRPRELIEPAVGDGQLDDAVWELVWAGAISSDTFAAVRALSHGGALKTPRPTRTGRRMLRPRRAPLNASGSTAGSSRWHGVQLPAADTGAADASTRQQAAAATERGVASALLQLTRHGVLTKGAVNSELIGGRFHEAYRVLSAMEEAGSARRGYFVEGLGAAQFALPGAVDRLREDLSSPTVLLAACDPANPYGAALSWPASDGHRPNRRAGALVVLDGGKAVLFLERGVRTLVTFGDPEPEQLSAALALIRQHVDQRRLKTVTIERINSSDALAVSWARDVLQQSGFVMVPQGYRYRPREQRGNR